MKSASFWKGAATVYAAWSLMAGLAMKATLPALNPLGVAYTGLTSPIAYVCIASGASCSNVPPQRYAKWLFTFPKDASHD